MRPDSPGNDGVRPHPCVMQPKSSPSCAAEHLSSHDADAPPAPRHETWHACAHRWVEMLPPPPDAELDAELLTLGDGSCIFGTMRSSACGMRTASQCMADAPAMVVLTLIQSGELLRDAVPGEQQRIGPGAIGLFDPRHMGDYRRSQGSREIFLALPRAEVAAVLGREPGNLLISPECCVLAPALASQLSHLALLMRRSEAIDGAEYAGLLDSTRKLALLALRNLGRQDGRRPDADAEDLHRSRYAVALRFMEREAHRHDLDVATIAQGTGCSRTRLYEAFAAQGATVMGSLRELRLQRAKTLIEQSQRLHVGALSWRCGFSDLSGFSKLFRARFGMSPSEWHHGARMHAAVGGQVPP